MEDMVKEYYNRICAGDEVRKNLIALRQEVKNEEDKEELRLLLKGDYGMLYALLKDDDPKVRKNAALILSALGAGDSSADEILDRLFAAYRKESTLYIRADFLEAISALDYRPLADELEKIRKELSAGEDFKPEDQKHVNAELHQLQMMLLHCRGIRRHRVTDTKLKTDVILTTNRCQREVTASQIRKGKITMLAGGVRVDGASLKEILGIRTYQDLLFPLETETLPLEEPSLIGERIAAPALALAQLLYRDEGPYLFRLELRGLSDERDRVSLLHRICAALEEHSHMQIINSVSDYEIELRLVLKKDGSFAAMLKAMGLAERRFSYRKEVVASSISPVNAALTVNLALPYLKEGAHILDPFCGVGTMLIERDKALKADTMYGIDIFGEAVEKGRRNAERAGCRINFINRDFFGFTHKYRFDELITDLPQQTASATKSEIRSLYHDFFAKIPDLLESGAVLVLYSTEPNYVLESVREHEEFEIEKKFLINEKKGTTVFVIFTK